jgi:hypothetical protein
VSLTREQILASRHDRKPVPFDVPEWGGTIWLRVLSAADQLAISEGLEARNVPLRVLVTCIVDDEGNRIFADDDADELAKEDFPIIMRVFGQAAKLNGLSNVELEDALASFAQAPDESISTE